ncbi:uncharacterized protein OCT59_009642 [Rhizophagus irregularis]|uniref:BAG domain-containing protein n=3 Tax=Rhizophagus irregularis TaxID=588596 RepID=A0A015KZ44_RHIIW|nr:hypothetical protein GLOIN_2v1560141 [Rhizophagus irregularis DAOM 181602=DAOM 197198]EXX72859.1 hypothetical protein RirG_065390 [Rhizophagus irregularis DAOM 197198w]POG75917.1 hypothetical protein GLOIN_2v1560141 [Rhizophagus irregularis DAOM 181602=DAOM 197198]UZO18326.1 hypothetical protein OCT59_009642 [Rhizophagus irregularis]GBC25203.2 hypothetical protein GLOIN_2v1560141 [Rhizophagus irregularis DAOM 181602=DAOM 197198]|eukprot:XP_025182783.1 hypothetical protein GLOIN_2v1560141 [Rhizophagus irregularis DAOM 181602=DAOM 197198]
MFTYPSFMYEPSTPPSFYPRTRNYPCSYYHNNYSPFYNQPELFYYSTPRNHFPFDEEDQREQLLREQFLRKQQEHEREQELERLKRFYDHKARQQKQPEASTYNTNYQPKKSFKVKIQSDEDETKAKINAAHKIYNFIKNQSANKQTHKILNKLYILHKIENELKEIQKTKYLGNLTFDKENGKQILPISIDNKNFLEYENKIVKSFDKLDEIQSEGVDIIRDRRKFLVKFAQTLLDELDIEKENQWKVFSENQSNLNTTNDAAPIITPISKKLESEKIENPNENVDTFLRII